jgi:hypothetical protein
MRYRVTANGPYPIRFNDGATGITHTLAVGKSRIIDALPFDVHNLSGPKGEPCRYWIEIVRE